MSFHDIEQLLLGQPVFVEPSKSSVTNGNPILLKSDASRLLTTLFFNPNYTIQKITAKDKLYAQNLEANYEEFTTQLNKPFAMNRFITIVSGKNTFSLDAKFTSLQFNTGLEYPFEIKKGYTIE